MQISDCGLRIGRQTAEASADGARLRGVRLTPRQAQCLALYYYDGLSQTQIGIHLGIGQRAVSQHLQYGLAKLAAAELTIARLSVEVTVKLGHMDTDALDSIIPESIRAVW